MKKLFALLLIVSYPAWPCVSGGTCQHNLVMSTAPSSSYGTLQDGGSVSAASTAMGVQQNDAAGGPPATCDTEYNAVATAGIDAMNSASPAIDAFPSNEGTGWRSNAAISGSFAASTWSWSVKLATSGGCHLQICMALWKSTNANLSSSTGATQIGTTQCSTNTNITGDHTGSVSPGAVTFTNEYLYFVGYYMVNDTGINSTCATINVGSSDSNVTTPIFTGVSTAILTLPITGVGQ